MLAFPLSVRYDGLIGCATFAAARCLVAKYRRELLEVAKMSSCLLLPLLHRLTAVSSSFDPAPSRRRAFAVRATWVRTAHTGGWDAYLFVHLQVGDGELQSTQTNPFTAGPNQSRSIALCCQQQSTKQQQRSMVAQVEPVWSLFNWFCECARQTTERTLVVFAFWFRV